MNTEYESYRREILRKATGAHIHTVMNKLHAIGMFYEIIEQDDSNENYYVSRIEETKSEIYKLLNPC